MAFGGLLGGGLGMGQYDPYQDLLRQQMMNGQRPITREEYERGYSQLNAAPQAQYPEPPKVATKKDDENLLLLTEEE